VLRHLLRSALQAVRLQVDETSQYATIIPVELNEPPAAHLEIRMTVGIRDHLENSFSLPPAVVEWLVSLYDAIQVFDDYADGDGVDRADLDTTIWNTLVGMPSNPFFMQNAGALLPAVGTMILKWQASDKAEREGKANEKSFVWRAGYYDLVLLCVQLCHGVTAAHKIAHHVMELYGENYKDYVKEFENA